MLQRPVMFHAVTENSLYWTQKSLFQASFPCSSMKTLQIWKTRHNFGFQNSVNISENSFFLPNFTQQILRIRTSLAMTSCGPAFLFSGSQEYFCSSPVIGPMINPQAHLCDKQMKLESAIKKCLDVKLRAHGSKNIIRYSFEYF